MSLAPQTTDDPLQRGEDVMVRLGPAEGVVEGTVKDTGPRVTVAIYDGTTYIEVDEMNCWRVGLGYAVGARR